MEVSLKTRITEDMKTALRAQDRARLGAVRLILAAVKQKEIDGRALLSNTEIVSVLGSMAKQRKEAIDQYRIAKRNDLVDKETFELSVIQHYMPEPLDSNALDALIKEAIAEIKASSPREMGQVMATLKPKIQGRADMATVGTRVKTLLGL